MSTLPHPDEVADHVVFEQSDGLYGPGSLCPERTTSEKLSDKAHFEKAERAGKCVYALHRFDDRRSWLTVLECNEHGNLGAAYEPSSTRNSISATAILDASFLPDGRLFVVMHVNPSLDVALALGAQAGDRMVMAGNSFTWDKNRQAYRLLP